MPSKLLHLLHGPLTDGCAPPTSPKAPSSPPTSHQDLRFGVGPSAAGASYGAGGIGQSGLPHDSFDGAAMEQFDAHGSAVRPHGALASSHGTEGSHPTRDLQLSVGSCRFCAPSFLMLLIGGGSAARVDVLQACRRGWDIIVFAGTGGLADEIARRLMELKQNKIRLKSANAAGQGTAVAEREPAEPGSAATSAAGPSAGGNGVADTPKSVLALAIDSADGGDSVGRNHRDPASGAGAEAYRANAPPSSPSRRLQRAASGSGAPWDREASSANIVPATEGGTRRRHPQRGNEQPRRTGAPPPKDVVLEEIVAIGKLAIIHVDRDSTANVAQILHNRLRPQPLANGLVLSRGSGKLKGSSDIQGGKGASSGTTLLTAKVNPVLKGGMAGGMGVSGSGLGGGGSGGSGGGSGSGSLTTGGIGKMRSGGSSGGGRSGESVLLHAWQTYGEYKSTSERQNRHYYYFESVLMALSLLTTLLVALDSDVKFNTQPTRPNGRWSTWQRSVYEQGAEEMIKTFIMLAPIMISVTIAFKNRFNFFAKSMALKEAATEIKREIFTYRTNAAKYRDPKFRTEHLATAIKEIKNKVLKTDASSTSVKPLGYGGHVSMSDPKFRAEVLMLAQADSGVGNIDVSEYLDYRLEFQLVKYRKEARVLHSRLQTLEYSGYLLNGIAIAMILVQEEVWVASLIVLLNIMSNIVAVGMYEDRLMRTNEAIVTLDALRSWWYTLDEAEQIKHESVNRCVIEAENVIFAHTIGALSKQKKQNHTSTAESHSSSSASASSSPSSSSSTSSKAAASSSSSSSASSSATSSSSVPVPASGHGPSSDD